MKITRSSKTSLKFATAEKRKILDQILDEYESVVNFFIGYFWEHREIGTKDEIYGLPETWFTAGMRQCAAREAFSMVLAAKNTENRRKNSAEREVEELLGQEIFGDPVKPVHNGKK